MHTKDVLPQVKKPARSRLSKALRVGSAVAVAAAGVAFGAAGCLTRPLCVDDCAPKTTNIYVDTIQNEAVDKIDLLFMIDNSASMADKQALFGAAVPDLVTRLVSPLCVSHPDPNDQTIVQIDARPTDPTTPCPTGSEREFTPIRNIHIGVISSSLGGFGGGKCEHPGTLRGEEEEDNGNLIGTRPRYLAVEPAGAPRDPTGFLNWNPDQNPGQDPALLNNAFSVMVTKTGEIGCGFEASFEAVYRFLVDPNPPEKVVMQGDSAVRTGRDLNVINSRNAFLRPDSLLAVIMLTDENDCSMRDEGIYNYPARTIAMPRGSLMCDSNPNDPCCYSCGSPTPSGCDPNGCQNRTFAAGEDPGNLRCYRHKQRFGVDFLFPTQRYVNMLTKPQICTSNPDLGLANCADTDGIGGPDIYPNPIFNDPNGSGALPRNEGLVFLAGILGVPYQLIDDPNSPTVLKYQTAADLRENQVWPQILGDLGNPAGPVEPSDPHMVESVAPRGQLPGTGAGLMADPIHGHEWLNSAQQDLQYACIFRLPADRFCEDSATLPPFDINNNPPPDCDCRPAPDNKPLCQAPDGTYDFTQRYGKAYPGIRELQVLKDFGDNSIVASICAKSTNPADEDYGYRPAVAAIVDRLAAALQSKCLPRRLAPDEVTGAIPCSIVEASPVPMTCDAARGRSEVTIPAVETEAKKRLKEKGACDVEGRNACNSFSFCMINEASAAAGNDVVCQNEKTVPGGTTPGWCYVEATDAGRSPVLGAGCDQILRFIDPQNQTPMAGTTALIACFGAPI